MVKVNITGKVPQTFVALQRSFFVFLNPRQIRKLLVRLKFGLILQKMFQIQDKYKLCILKVSQVSCERKRLLELCHTVILASVNPVRKRSSGAK